MKICFINPTDTYRVEVFSLADKLIKEGIQVKVLSPYFKARNNNIIMEKIPAFFVPKIHYTIPDFYSEYKSIANSAQNENYDIIQICDYDYLTSIPAGIFKYKSNIPLIVSTDAFPGISWFFGNKLVDSVAKIYTHTIGKAILNMADKIIVLSNNLHNDSVDYNLYPNKVQVIPNGIDASKYYMTEKKNDCDKKEIIILYVGRITLVKKIEVLIEIANILNTNNIKFKLLLIGTGEYIDYYKNKAKRIKNIYFLGYVSHDKLIDYYNKADIFILSSISEGLPNVLLEASASGVCIIANNTGGISDIVIHEKTGYLVEDNDLKQYIKYIYVLISDENKRVNMGKEARKHIIKKFNWSTITKQYIEMYEKLIE